MNKKILSIIMIMILLVSSVSVYSALPENSDNAGATTPQQPPSSQNWLNRAQIYSTPDTVYVYHPEAQTLDTYVRTENGLSPQVSGSSVSMGRWNDMLGEISAAYPPGSKVFSTSSEDNVASTLSERFGPVEAAPQETPTPEAAIPETPVLDKEEEPETPPAPEAEKEEEHVTPDRNPVGSGNPERYKYLLGIVQEADQNRESSDAATVAAYERWQQAQADFENTPVSDSEAWRQAARDEARARREYDQAVEAAQIADQSYRELQEFQQAEIDRSSLTPGGVGASADQRQNYAMSLADRDREITSLLGTLNMQQSALQDQIDAAEAAGQNTEALEAELEEIEDQEKTLREQQSNMRDAQVDYGRNLGYQNTLTEAVEYNNNVAIPEANADYDTAWGNYQSASQVQSGMMQQAIQLQAALDEARAGGAESFEMYGQEIPIDQAQTEIDGLTAEAVTYYNTHVEPAAIQMGEASTAIAELQHQNEVFEKNRAEFAQRAEFLRLQNEIDVAQQEIERLQGEIAKAESGAARDRLEDQLYDWERHLARTQNRAAWHSPWLSGNNFLFELANTFGRVLIFIFDFVSAYNEYRGIGAYTSLDSNMAEQLNQRRRETAQHFCQDVVYLAGTSCLQSTICEKWSTQSEPLPGTSILTTEIPNVGRLPAASIQAEKSLPIRYELQGQQKTKYLYKITYFIENPHLNDVLSYHLELRGANVYQSPSRTLAGRTLSGGSEQRGKAEGATGNNPLIFDGQYDYAAACLVFSPRIFVSGGGYASEICVPIQQYSGAATMPYELPAETQVQLQNQTGVEPSGLSMDGA